MFQCNEYISEHVSQKCNEYESKILEENQEISEKYENLKVLYENVLYELNAMQDTIKELKEFQKMSIEESIRQEELLLNETSALEISLNFQIHEIESEKQQLQRELFRVTDERDQLIRKNSEIIKDKCEVEGKMISLKAKLLEMEENEENMKKKFIELEMEHTFLQEKEFNLKSCQGDLEISKVKIIELMETNESFQIQKDKLEYLLNAAEKRIEEFEQNLFCEQENNIMLKKELEMYKNPDSLSIITTNLAESLAAADNREESFNIEGYFNRFDSKKNFELFKSCELNSEIEQVKKISMNVNDFNNFRSEVQISLDTSNISNLKNSNKRNDFKKNMPIFTYSVPDILVNLSNKVESEKKNSISENKITQEMKCCENFYDEMKKDLILKRSLSISNGADTELLKVLKIFESLKIQDLDLSCEKYENLSDEIVHIKEILQNNRDKISMLMNLLNSAITISKPKCTSFATLNLQSSRPLRLQLNIVKDVTEYYLNLSKSITNYCEKVINQSEIEKILNEKQEMQRLLECEIKEKEILVKHLNDLEIKFEKKRQRKRKFIKQCWKVITCSTNCQAK